MATSSRELINENARGHWLPRVIEWTRGRNTPLGAIVVAFTGHNRINRWPRFSDKVTVDPSGTVWGSMTDQYGKWHPWVNIITTVQLRDALRQMSAKLQLTDQEQEELFEKARQWISKDLRNQNTLPPRKGREI